jgi:putative copper export protein
LGAAAIATSFAQVGHASVHASRWFLVPLLDFHLVVAAFWFGSIGPLIVAARHERSSAARQLVDAFSSLAGWLVPMIAVAGLLMGWILTRGQLSVGNPYDLILGAKMLLFATLMAMAAINRWRMGPALGDGTRRSMQAFCRSLILEYVLIAGVIVLTAVMTSLYGPEA